MTNTLQLSYRDAFPIGGARNGELIASSSGRRTALVTSRVEDKRPPASVALRATKGKSVLNVAGATSFKGTPQEQAEQIRRMFLATHNLFGGHPQYRFRFEDASIGSGGTSVLDGVNPLTAKMTAVEAPGLALRIAMMLYPDNPEYWPWTWGHAPQTNTTLGYGGDEHGSFHLTDELETDIVPNPLIHLLWLLTQSAGSPLDWNGDLEKYIQMMDAHENPLQLVLSGGAFTAEEVRRSLELGFPVLGCLGLGRASDDLLLLKQGRTDQIVEEGIRKEYQIIERKRYDLGLITLFHWDDPATGQRWLQEHEVGVMLGNN